MGEVLTIVVTDLALRCRDLEILLDIHLAKEISFDTLAQIAITHWVILGCIGITELRKNIVLFRENDAILDLIS
jgi:hypothetical protein